MGRRHGAILHVPQSGLRQTAGGRQGRQVLGTIGHRMDARRGKSDEPREAADLFEPVFLGQPHEQAQDRFIVFWMDPEGQPEQSGCPIAGRMNRDAGHSAASIAPADPPARCLYSAFRNSEPSSMSKGLTQSLPFVASRISYAVRLISA